MRRFLLTAAIAFSVLACRQERPATPSPAQQPVPAAKPLTPAPAPVTPKVNRSTPDRCAGDGSYAQALECFRSTSRLDFSVEEAKGVRAEGEMQRPTPGAERERFTLRGAGADDGEWSGEAKAAGVIWTHRGQRATSEPAIVDRIWQRTTLYIDPQKKEGDPQRAGEETVDGEPCVRYRFSDANNGDVHDVWVSARDGHITKIKVESHGAFPSYEMTVKKMGK